MDRLLNHLKKSRETYFGHLLWAIYSGLVLILTGIISIVHGLFPFLFERWTAATIIDFYYRKLHNHPNPEYQQMIAEAKALSDSDRKA